PGSACPCRRLEAGDRQCIHTGTWHGRAASTVNASVILCTHNRATLLRRALESLADLDVPSGLAWELLVVDNNSTDDTRAIVEQERAEARLPCRYLYEPSQRKSFALNTGIARGLGQVLGVTDDGVT